MGEFLYHLSVAYGSLMEVETQLLIAIRLCYVAENDAKALLDQLGEVRRLLAGMIRSLQPRRRTSRTR